jgi:hypothetical protein
LGAPTIALVAEVAGLVVMTLALGALLPPFGIIGAALGTLVGLCAIG